MKNWLRKLGQILSGKEDAPPTNELPPQPTTISVKVDSAIMDQLDDLGALLNCSRQASIRKCIRLVSFLVGEMRGGYTVALIGKDETVRVLELDVGRVVWVEKEDTDE